MGFHFFPSFRSIVVRRPARGVDKVAALIRERLSGGVRSDKRLLCR